MITTTTDLTAPMVTAQATGEAAGAPPAATGRRAETSESPSAGNSRDSEQNIHREDPDRINQRGRPPRASPFAFPGDSYADL